jgi:hypothetical protein
MLELHQTEEGMQLLSSRPAACSRCPAERIKGSEWDRKSLGRVFPIDFFGSGTIRGSANSSISSPQHAFYSGSRWPSDETPENRKLFPGK